LLGLSITAFSKDALHVVEATCFSESGVRLKVEAGSLGCFYVWFRQHCEAPFLLRTPHLQFSYQLLDFSTGQAPLNENRVKQFLKSIAAKLSKKTFRTVADIVEKNPISPTEQNFAYGSAAMQGNMGADTTDTENTTFRTWGAPEQWKKFIVDEIVGRNIEDAINVCNSAEVTHGDFECLCVHPYVMDNDTMSFYNAPWKPRPPTSPTPEADTPDPQDTPQRTARHSRFSTDVDDMDVICGGAEKLSALLDDLTKRDDYDVIRINTTCVPMIIGDDVESELARFREKSRVPVMYKDQMMHSPLRQFVELLDFHPDPARPAPPRNSVNFVGFPRDASRDELLKALRDIGVAVNVCLFPEMRMCDIDRYLNARTQVFIPNMAYSEIFTSVFSSLPMKAVLPEAPYGLSRTWKWIESVATAAGRKKAFVSYRDEHEAEISRRMQPLVDEARSFRLAFVADASQVSKLANASSLWGIPMLPVIEEMGFGIDLLEYNPPGANIVNHIGSLRSTLSNPELLHVSYFDSQETLSRQLHEDEFQAVYSDFFYDRRLTRAGKAQFSLNFFEKGFDGALRSARRLIEICRLPFYRRYARYLPDRRE
jgi:hypothetical protein